LNGSPAQDGSAVRQLMQTVPGKRHRIRLASRANECCFAIGSVKTLRVTAGATVSEHALVVDASNGCNFSVWTVIQRDCTADSTSSIIELRSLVSNNADGSIVDDVSIIALPCPRDIAGKGTVDGVDLALIRTTRGTNGAQGGVNCDLNGDSIVNGSDLAIVLSGWGACP
jgi:hypothetical protein